MKLFKLKRKNIILVSLLAIAGFLGISSVAVNHTVKDTPKAEKADAATNKHFFLDCVSCSGWDSESICIHTWNGSKDVYIEATKVADNYWYVVMDTTGCSGYRWYRCAKGNTGTRWNESGWNGNINNNYCSIKGYDSNAQWSGSTSGCEETYEIASTTPSTSTKRIWVDPKDHFYDQGARAGLRVFSGSGHYKTYILGGSSQYVNMTHESTTQYFFYVDIPVDYGCQLVRLHNAFDFVWTYSADMTDTTTQFTFSWDTSASLSVAGLDDDANYTDEYAKKVLDGFSTCISSSVNGYGAYTSINTNVLSKLSSSELSSLKASTFSAPGYGTRTYEEKITRLANSGSLPNASLQALLPFSFAGNGEASFSTLIIIVSSSVALLSVTALSILVIRKRKSKED